VLLGAGETNLRLAHEAAAHGDPEPAEVREWASQVYLLGQRLLLRLPGDDPVVASYQNVRDALVTVGQAYGDQAPYQDAAAKFEVQRTLFLDEARAALERKVKL
jgi:hypothetical protein